MFERFITTTIHKNQSYLLLGPRQTGKSTLIKGLLTPDDLYINLLPHGNYLAYTKNPRLFYEEVLFHYKQKGATCCFVDEIQKIPPLLHDIHELIESTKMSFILTGSSARALRKQGVNLLAGRANSRSIFPLIYQELGEIFSLEKALLYGMLPKIWNGDLASHDTRQDFLQSYSHTYLREEIQQEGLLRNLDTFPRFLDLAAVNDGQIVSYTTMARECGVSSKTIKKYYEILEDTFLSHRVDGWSQSARKQLTSHPKYYFFDVGITNALSFSLKETLNSVERGRRFEQFVMLQLIAYNEYEKKGLRFFHWRDKNHIEIDMLLTRNNVILAALECKSSSHITAQDGKSLEIFRYEHPETPAYVIGCEGNQREIRPNIFYCNWKDFLEKILPGLSAHRE